ncbi:MAG: hypothetical protein Q7R33_08050 [Nitrosarchaeum sp.]|nr:hypothetical protein [Nitrosarchaeum sp.]
MKTLKISKTMLETFGDHSLEGLIYKTFNEFPKDLRIEFEQSTMTWRQENKGPEEIIIPEFVPMTLCKSILSLSKQLNLEIDEYN